MQEEKGQLQKLVCEILSRLIDCLSAIESILASLILLINNTVFCATTSETAHDAALYNDNLT